MATDAKKHETIAAGEAPTRAKLAAAVFSINDVVPVANATEAGQVAVAVAAAGQVLASNPLFVSRADARGLHRIEYTYNGTVWLPASGVLAFANLTDATSWAATNGAYLTVGDLCRIGAFDFKWNGSAWVGGPATLTAAAGITLTHRVHRIGNLIVCDVSATKATDMGTNETVTTLPAEFRPVNNVTGGLHLGASLNVITAAFGSVLNTGEIKVNALGAAGVRNVFFNLSWVRDS